MIEVLVAVAILAFIGVTVARALDTNARASRILDEQVQAVNLATAYFEAIKELPYDNAYPEYSSAGDNITIPTQYSVVINVDYSNDAITWVDTYTDETLQKITISVSREGGKPVLALCNLRTER